MITSDTEVNTEIEPEPEQVVEQMVEPSGAIVMYDPSLDPDNFLLEGIDTSEKPLFAIGEVAKVFFAMTTVWIRWAERKGKLTLDGVKVAQGRTDTNIRKYSLSDIELMAHALAQNGAITSEQLRHVLALVAIEAAIYDYL